MQEKTPSLFLSESDRHIFYLEFSQQFLHLSATGCRQLNLEKESAIYLATRDEFHQLGYKILDSEQDSPIRVEYADSQQREVYDITQTDCYVEEFPNLGIFQRAIPSQEEQVLRMTYLSEVCGVMVVDYADDGRFQHGGYQVEHNIICINQDLPAKDKLDLLCNAFSEALVENTSTLSGEHRKLESNSLYAALRMNHGLDIGEQITKSLQKSCTVLQPRDISRIQDNTHRKMQMITQKLSFAPTIQRETSPAQGQKRTNKQAQPTNISKQEISENFMSNL